MVYLRAMYVIFGVTLHYFGYRRFLRSPQKEQTRPKKLVQFLLELGPVFVKIGQILSTRQDILHSRYAEELSVLQEAQPEIAWPIIKKQIEHEFSTPINEVFDEIDPNPVAAATLAQVHRGRLSEGTVVAVKVQRPKVEAQIRRDMKALESALAIAKFLFPNLIKRSNLCHLFDEFRKYTIEELDFENEANNIDAFKTQFLNTSFVRIPDVYSAQSTSRVLTMDWVEGATMEQALTDFDQSTLKNLTARLVETLLTMFVANGHYHADLHPGNIRFHSDGTFTLMDFGMAGRLTETQCDRFVLYMSAVVQKQTEHAFSIFAEQTIRSPDADEQAFRAAFFELADRFYSSTLLEVSFAKIYVDMMQAGIRFGFRFPSEIILHGKALTTAESLIFTLNPDARFDDLAREHVAKLVFDRTIERMFLLFGSKLALSELILLGRTPKIAGRIDAPGIADFPEVLSRLYGSLPQLLKQAGDNHEFWRFLFTADAEEILYAEEQVIDVDLALQDAWSIYDDLEQGVKVYDTLGAIFTTHVALTIIAMNRALQKQGLTETKSAEIIFRIGWKFYNRLGEIPLQIARAFTKDPSKRMKVATDLFRKFPFGEPSYEWADVSSDANTIAFDCHKCPMAEVFKLHDEGDLCVRTACELDFPLAKKWGGQLSRKSTIAGGASLCNFRWEVHSKS